MFAKAMRYTIQKKVDVNVRRMGLNLSKSV